MAETPSVDKDACVCPVAPGHSDDEPNGLCLGVPGETSDCAACLALDPEEPCLHDPEVYVIPPAEPVCMERAGCHDYRHGTDCPRFDWPRVLDTGLLR